MVLDNKNVISYGYIIISLLVIGILTYLYITKKPSESFCSCRNMTNKICPDPNVLTKLYETGKLTEYTNFANIQKDKDNWKNLVMPEDEFASHKYT